MGVELPRALKSDIYHGRNLSLEYYNMNILTPFFLSREMNESNFRRAKLRIYIYFNYFSKGKKKKNSQDFRGVAMQLDFLVLFLSEHHFDMNG